MPKSRNRPHHKKRIDKRVADQQRIDALKAAARNALKIGQQAWMVLIAVLQQQGGSATVTQGTLDQVGMNLARLDYIVEPSTVKGEYTVRVREEQANGGSGTDTQESHDGDDRRPGETGGSAAGITGTDGSDTDGSAVAPERVDRKPRDFSVNRIDDDVATEGGH